MINPEQVTEGRPAKFGEPILLDLSGFGVRSIAPYGDGYLIVAGPYDGDEASQLYRWDGKSAEPQRLSPNGLAGNPEGLAVIREGDRDILFVLNDDGTRTIAGRDCKKLKDPTLKVFRGYELPL
jgi:hypothetical protein